MSAPRRDRIWWFTVAPAAWLLQLAASYATAAIYCAKAPHRSVSLMPVRIACLVYAAVALGVALAMGVSAYRQYGRVSFADDHLDREEARQAFIGMSLMLLSGASILGTVYVALPAIFMETCR